MKRPHFGTETVRGLWCGVIVIWTVFALSIPAWRGPDEKGHVAYVSALVQGHLPIIPHGMTADISSGTTYQGQHPPLYYLAAVPVYYAVGKRPDAALYMLRIINVALLGIALLLTYDIGLLLVGPRAARWGVLIAGLHTTLIYCESFVGNEALAIVLGLLAVRSAARARAQNPLPSGHFIVQAALFGGFALLSKLTALPLVVAAACLMAEAPGFRRYWQPLAVGVGAVAVWSPWAVVMQAHYGTLAPATFFPLFNSFGEVLLLPRSAIKGFAVTIGTLFQGIFAPLFLIYPLLTSMAWYYFVISMGWVLLVLLVVLLWRRPEVRCMGPACAALACLIVYQAFLRDRDVLVTGARYFAPMVPLLCLGLGQELVALTANLRKATFTLYSALSLFYLGFIVYFYRHGL